MIEYWKSYRLSIGEPFITKLSYYILWNKTFWYYSRCFILIFSCNVQCCDGDIPAASVNHRRGSLKSSSTASCCDTPPRRVRTPCLYFSSLRAPRPADRGNRPQGRISSNGYFPYIRRLFVLYGSPEVCSRVYIYMWCVCVCTIYIYIYIRTLYSTPELQKGHFGFNGPGRPEANVAIAVSPCRPRGRPI